MQSLKCLKCHKVVKNRPIYGLHALCFLEWFKLPEPSVSFRDLDLKKTGASSVSSSILSSSITKDKGSFYHGRYRKYSAKLGDCQYILKVQEPKFPDLPAMEYLCNQIASYLGLKVPPYYLIKFNGSSQIGQGDFTLEQKSLAKPSKHTQNSQNFTTSSQQFTQSPSKHTQHTQNSQNLMTFVTKNFMQNYSSGTLHHIYKYLPKGDKHYNCQNIIKSIGEQTGRLVDVEQFIKICLFDSFTGNGDRHGRNLGIIDTGKKRFLAPMYDNPSNFGVEPEDMLNQQFNFSGCIWTASAKEPKINDYIKEFKRLNLNTPCLQFIKQIIKQFPTLVEEVKKSAISEKRKQAFIRYLKDRLKDVKEAKEEHNA